MSTLKFFLSLIRLIDSTTNDLGLGSLTDSDRVVLLALWNEVDEKTSHSSLSFDLFAQRTKEQDTVVSRSQFFKSLKKLEDLELIKRVDGVRSATYKLRAE